MNITKILILVGSLGTCSGLLAADPQQIQSGYDVVTVTKTIIAEVVQQVENSFQSIENHGGFDAAGKTIMYFLFAGMATWAAFKGMVGNGFNSFLEEFFSIAITFGLIQAFLWSGGIDAIEGFIDSIAASIAGEDMSDISSALSAVSIHTFNAVFDVLSMPALTSDSGFNIVESITAIPQFLMQVIAKLLAAVFIVIGAGIYFANVIIAYGSILIAKALAPLMLPWLILPAASFLFDGWLRFFIGACLFKVVGAFFLSMTSTWIAGISKISSYVKVDQNIDPVGLYNGNMVIYMAIILLSMVSAYLMILAPTVASGLISGSNRAAFSGTSALTNGAGGKMTGAAMRGVSGGISKGASSVSNMAQNAANSYLAKGGVSSPSSANQAIKGRG